MKSDDYINRPRVARGTTAGLIKNGEIAGLRKEVAQLRECLHEAINNECNYCRTVRKDGTYGKCEHLKEDGECDCLRDVKCIVHKWRKALEGAKDGK